MAGELNFPTHTKGDTFPAVEFTVTGIDLSASTITMDVRNAGKRVARFDNDTNGGITLVSGTQFTFDEQVINFQPATYQYDIQITESDGTITTLLGGNWVITQDVTHD